MPFHPLYYRQIADNAPDVFVNFCYCLGGIDANNPHIRRRFRIIPENDMVFVRDLLLKRLFFVYFPRDVSLSDPFHRSFRRQVKEKKVFGERKRCIDCLRQLLSRREPLIGKAGKQIAVGKDRLPRFELF